MNRIHRHLSTVTALTSLERYGKQSSSTYGRIDSLTYTYNGNQLTAISDNAPTPTISESFDFRNGTGVSTEYLYDANGLLSDVTKGNNESLQKYKFEGKELDRTFGLDNYDIHARQYFSMMPTWDRIDPLAEKYYGISPYVYCGGDPVNRMDFLGKDWYSHEDSVEIDGQK